MLISGVIERFATVVWEICFKCRKTKVLKDTRLSLNKIILDQNVFHDEYSSDRENRPKMIFHAFSAHMIESAHSRHEL